MHVVNYANEMIRTDCVVLVFAVTSDEDCQPTEAYRRHQGRPGKQRLSNGIGSLN